MNFYHKRIYQAIYNCQIEKTKSDEEFVKQLSILDAQFRFWRETAPKDRELVKNILSFKLNGPDSMDLKNYLRNKGFMYNEKDNNFYIEEHGDDRILTVKSHNIFRLGLDLTIKSHKIIPLEGMFDLDGLNKFILTGKIN